MVIDGALESGLAWSDAFETSAWEPLISSDAAKAALAHVRRAETRKRLPLDFYTWDTRVLLCSPLAELAEYEVIDASSIQAWGRILLLHRDTEAAVAAIFGPRVLPHVVRFMFLPLQHLRQQAERLLGRPAAQLVGLQIRARAVQLAPSQNLTGALDIGTVYPSMLSARMVEQIITCGVAPGITGAFVATDNPHVTDLAGRQFGSVASNRQAFAASYRQSRAHEMQAVVDLWALSRCGSLVVSPFSTFGFLALAYRSDEAKGRAQTVAMVANTPRCVPADASPSILALRGRAPPEACQGRQQGRFAAFSRLLYDARCLSAKARRDGPRLFRPEITAYARFWATNQSAAAPRCDHQQSSSARGGTDRSIPSRARAEPACLSAREAAARIDARASQASRPSTATTDFLSQRINDTGAFMSVRVSKRGVITTCSCFGGIPWARDGSEITSQQLARLQRRHPQAFDALDGLHLNVYLRNLHFWAAGKSLPRGYFPALGFAAFEAQKSMVIPWPSFNSWYPGWKTLYARGSFEMPVPPPWRERHNVLVWRGSAGKDWGYKDRARLLNHTRKSYRPDLFNVKSVEEGDDSGFMSEAKQSAYKYTVYTAGAFDLYAWRLPLLLHTHLTFIANLRALHSPWFMQDLRAGVHYVPVEARFKNLSHAVLWARNNDGQAKRIFEAGRAFVRKRLIECNDDNVMRYLEQLGRLRLSRAAPSHSHRLQCSSPQCTWARLVAERNHSSQLNAHATTL